MYGVWMLKPPEWAGGKKASTFYFPCGKLCLDYRIMFLKNNQVFKTLARVWTSSFWNKGMQGLTNDQLLWLSFSYKNMEWWCVQALPEHEVL